MFFFCLFVCFFFRFDAPRPGHATEDGSDSSDKAGERGKSAKNNLKREIESEAQHNKEKVSVCVCVCVCVCVDIFRYVFVFFLANELRKGDL